MTADLWQEFSELGRRAEQELRDVPQSGSYSRLFTIWVRPSFQPSFRWSVYAPRRSANPMASYLVWRSDVDAEKLRTPVERLKHPKELAPTIEHDAVDLDAKDIENFTQRIR